MPTGGGGGAFSAGGGAQTGNVTPLGEGLFGREWGNRQCCKMTHLYDTSIIILGLSMLPFIQK